MSNGINIVKMLEQAAAKLKYPKIRLTAGGAPLVLSRAGDRARYPGSVNMTDGAGFPDNRWYGRIHTDGRIEWSRTADDKVTRVVSALSKNPEHVVALYGKRSGVCSCCGQPLSDDRSLAVGYGPTCAKNWGLPWGNSGHKRDMLDVLDQHAAADDAAADDATADERAANLAAMAQQLQKRAAA